MLKPLCRTILVFMSVSSFESLYICVYKPVKLFCILNFTIIGKVFWSSDACLETI